MSFTNPAYALPIVLDGTEQITVTMAGGSTSSTYTATLTAGTYYNHDPTEADSFGLLVKAELNAAEITAGNTATWSVVEDTAALTHTYKLTRTGDTSDSMTSFGVSSALMATFLGLEGVTTTAGTELANASDDTTITPTYQMGYLWAPRTILTRDVRPPLSSVAGTITAPGRAVVDGYGAYQRIRHTIEFVPAALVYDDKAADSDYITCVDNLEVSDPNTTLETFWGLCRTLSDGNPPVIKYWADDTYPTGTDEDIVIADVEWLTDMEAVAEEQNPAPLLYRVIIRAMESVSTSFTPTGNDVVSGAVQKVDTPDDLPADPADGTERVVVSTGACLTYISTLTYNAVSYPIKAWVPSTYVERGAVLWGDGSTNPAYLSVVDNSDDVSTLTGRGWSTHHTGSSTATDITDAIRMTASSGNSELRFTATPDSAKEYLIIAEIDAQTYVGGQYYAGLSFNLASTNNFAWLTWTAFNSATDVNIVAFHINSGNMAGSEQFDIGTGYTPVYMAIQPGGSTTYDNRRFGGRFVYAWWLGSSLYGFDGQRAAVDISDYGATTLNGFRLFISRSSSTKVMDVRKAIVLEVPA